MARKISCGKLPPVALNYTETSGKAYLSDVSSNEWAFVAPYLSLMTDRLSALLSEYWQPVTQSQVPKRIERRSSDVTA
jgi:hypothetical protein